MIIRSKILPETEINLEGLDYPDSLETIDTKKITIPNDVCNVIKLIIMGALAERIAFIHNTELTEVVSDYLQRCNIHLDNAVVTIIVISVRNVILSSNLIKNTETKLYDFKEKYQRVYVIGERVQGVYSDESKAYQALEAIEKEAKKGDPLPSVFGKTIIKDK